MTVAPRAFLAAMALMACPAGTIALAAPACTLVPLALDGAPDKKGDRRAELSGVVLDGDKLVAISNEPLKHNDFPAQVFRRSGAGYVFDHDEVVARPDGTACVKADFEGLTRAGETYFAIGSHSLTSEGEACPERRTLVSFRLTGAPGRVQSLALSSLDPIITAHPDLKGHVGQLPKEGGVDIEGLAAQGGHLFVGFRGQVAGNNALVLVIPQDLAKIGPSTTTTRHVDLGGRGIRDLAPLADGRLVILAGPSGKDKSTTFRTYIWDGLSPSPELECDLGPFGGTKPEGIALIPGEASPRRYVLVYDGKWPLTASILTGK